MRKKILVTGAAGFIAHHLITRLLEAGAMVVGIDNFDPYYSVELKEQNVADLKAVALKTGSDFLFERIDFADGQDALAGLPDVDAIIHLGAKAGVRPSVQDPQGYIRANIVGTQSLLSWAKARGVKTFIFGSSSSVYGDSTPVPFAESAPADAPISPYAATKRAGEHFCASAAHLDGMKICSLRFFTVYGPRQRPDLAIRLFMTKILGGETITLYGDGSTARDYTWVGDIVEGVVAALEYALKAEKPFHEVFNLGGSQTTTLRQLVSLIEDACGTKAKIDWKPLQPGEVERTFADVSKASRILGYAPNTPIAVGIPRMVEWYRSTLKPAAQTVEAIRRPIESDSVPNRNPNRQALDSSAPEAVQELPVG